jgi:hypothetical protein
MRATCERCGATKWPLTSCAACDDHERVRREVTAWVAWRVGPSAFLLALVAYAVVVAL